MVLIGMRLVVIIAVLRRIYCIGVDRIRAVLAMKLMKDKEDDNGNNKMMTIALTIMMIKVIIMILISHY